MLKRIISLILAILLFTALIPVQAFATESGDDTYVLSGVLIPQMSGRLDVTNSSFKESFTVPVDAKVIFDFSGSTDGYYFLHVYKAGGTDIVAANIGSNGNGVPYTENTVVDLPAGNYEVRVKRTSRGAGELTYVFSARYERVYTNDDPLFYVSPNPEACVIYADEPGYFTVEALPASAPIPEVTWSSSDTSIAKVSQSGKVTGKKSGVVTLTAKVGGTTLSHELEVIKPKYSKLKDFSLYVGEKKTLKITVTPSDYPIKEIKWKSSDKSVATVSSKGVVKAKKAGEATITATVNGKEISCVVTVKKMAINKTKKTIYVGETYKLKINGGTGDVEWSSSDKKIAKVSSSGKVTAKKPGTATITAVKNRKTFKCKVTVKWPPENGITTTDKIDLSNGSNYESKTLTLNAKSTVTITAKVNSGTDYLFVCLSDRNYSMETLWSANVYKEDGKVTKKITLAAGKYDLSYSTDSNAEVTVSVKTKPQIVADSKYVGRGYTKQLKLEGVKNGGTWSSSDTNIATVNSKGVVKGKKNGTCTIYLKMKDGEKISYKIKVVNPVVLEVTNVYDTTIYNECDVKFYNYTNKTIEYIEFDMKQYDYKDRRVYGPYDYYYCDTTIEPYGTLTLYEYWVADMAKTIKPYVLEVKFTDGTYWKP